MVEVELEGVEEALDPDGVPHLALRLSNGNTLQLYGNGIGLAGTEGFLDYGDLVDILSGKVTVLVAREDEEGLSA